MNVLLIFTDQQRLDTIGAYGGRMARTPNLDKLAAGSVVFDQAICPQPVCTPSRGSLMTGVYPHTHGCVINCMTQPGYYEMILPPALPTMAELLKDAGYRAGYVGKWHIGNEVVPQHGFEEYWASTEDEYTRAEDRARLGYSGYHRYLVSRGFIPRNDFFSREETAGLPEEHSRIEFVTREAERFLETNAGRAFMLVVNYLEPHPPYEGPLNGMYRPADIALPANFHTEPLPGMPLRARIFQRFARTLPQSGVGPFQQDGDDNAWKEVAARYLGLVTLVDRHIGRLLDRLAGLGLEEDTLVIFTSDHGDMMGSHGMLNKCVMYEEALRVPLMIRCPGGRAGGLRIGQTVNLTDIAPTVLDALGLPIPPHVQGESLAPILSGRLGEDPDKPSFSEWNGILQWMHKRHKLFEPVAGFHIRAVRTSRWKLNVNPGDLWELYDLQNDPGEMRNLIGDNAHSEIVGQLLTALRAWQSRTGDTMEIGDVNREKV